MARILKVYVTSSSLGEPGERVATNLARQFPSVEVKVQVFSHLLDEVCFCSLGGQR